MQQWLLFGQVLRPIFDMIDFDHIIIDMLHLLLRIGEKLITLLIADIASMADPEELQSSKEEKEREKEEKKRVEKGRKEGTNTFFFLSLDLLKETKKLKIPFDFITLKSGELTFKTINAKNLKLLLSKLDLSKVIPLERAVPVRKLWSDFIVIYDEVRYKNGNIPNLQELARTWLKDFTASQRGEVDLESLFNAQDEVTPLHPHPGRPLPKPH